jgi:hypothetical protein
MAAIDLVNLSALLDDAKCFALVRQHRWREGVRCPGCGSDAVIRNGCDDTQLTGSATGVRRVLGASTTSPAQCSPGTISRCECGCCASTLWG